MKITEKLAPATKLKFTKYRYPSLEQIENADVDGRLTDGPVTFTSAIAPA
jgi:hypothetical protein